MYVDIPKTELSENKVLVEFVCSNEDLDILEIRVNEGLYRLKKFLDSTNLEVAVEKTIAVMVTQSWSFTVPNIYVGVDEVK